MLLIIAVQTRMSGIVWVDKRLLDVLFKNLKLFPPYSGVHTKIPGRPLREWLFTFTALLWKFQHEPELSKIRAAIQYKRLSLWRWKLSSSYTCSEIREKIMSVFFLYHIADSWWLTLPDFDDLDGIVPEVLSKLIYKWSSYILISMYSWRQANSTISSLGKMIGTYQSITTRS